MARKPTQLTHKQIQTEVFIRLKKYERLNFLERYAMFMGVAQLLEIGLKQLAHRLYRMPFEKLERRTLGTMMRRAFSPTSSTALAMLL